MYIIKNSITESDVRPIISLALANYVDLANKVLRVSSPTSSLCKIVMEAEINAYLQDILTGCYGDLGGSITVAKDQKTGSVLGFALGMQSSCPEHCGINYTAVRSDARRKGILRAMLGPFQ